VEKLDKDAVQRFVETLSSKRFAEELRRRFKGFSVGEDVGSILYKPR